MEYLMKWEVRFLLISVLVLLLERLFTWRKEQKFLRPLLLQDVFWLFFNGLVVGMLFGPAFPYIAKAMYFLFGLVAGGSPKQFQLLEGVSMVWQIVIFALLLDFVEWCVHNLLHRVSFLWSFHRVHHSITQMDWIGNFRFHPFEIFFYYLFRVVPIALLSPSREVAMVVGSMALLIGHLNHSNINITWGPLRYVFNSPRMHIWHHDAKVRGRAGVNFAVMFSLWDWIFRTAYMPDHQPKRLGFTGDSKFPTALWRRMLLPFADLK